MRLWHRLPWISVTSLQGLEVDYLWMEYVVDVSEHHDGEEHVDYCKLSGDWKKKIYVSHNTRNVFCLFDWFDSLRPINNLSVIKGGSSWVEPVLN